MAELPENQQAEAIETVVNPAFVQKSSNLCPTLHTWQRKPQRLIEFVRDDDAYFGISMRQSGTVGDLERKTLGRGDEFIVDFGLHMVGYLHFKLSATGINIDAPCRLRLTFCESPLDATEGMNNVKTWISTSWLPDEIINVDVMPAEISLPRRHSFRYLRVEIIDTSPKYKVSFSDVHCLATSSVDPNTQLDDVYIQDPLLQAIDHISVSTLRDCMQTVFEDGPRRDRRIWIGDLRLQALVNYATFKDYNLVKRSLYMFAALPRVNKSLPACLFEKPELSPASDYIVDYDVLFGTIVHDYVVASGDLETGRELWDTIQGSLLCGLSHLDPETSVFDSGRTARWKFLDWAENLDTSAGMHGLLLYALKKVNDLARLLLLPPPYTDTIQAMTDAAAAFVKPLDGSPPPPKIISGLNSQLSLASAAWLTLSSALPLSTTRPALLYALNSSESVKPLTPYLWHHVAEALAVSGLLDECVDLIKSYWGGMMRAGADTFWECFDPANPRASPYGDVRNNSFCHAWSCTPAYLLRGILKDRVGVRVIGMVTMHELDERWVHRSCGNDL